MNAPICCAIAQKTAMDAITLADAPEFGHGEVAERPMAAPKVRRTNESAAARKAPARTAPHSTKLEPGVAVTLAPDWSWTYLCHGVVLPACTSVETEKAQDEHHDDDEADEIDDAVHLRLPRV